MSNEIVRVTEAYTAFKANSEPYGFCGFEAFKAGVEWQRSLAQAELAALKAKMSGVDERVAFEAAYLKANYPRVAAGELSAPPIFGRVGSMKFHGQAEGDYECSDVQTCWVIWQARAAIPMVIPNGYALVPAQPQSDCVMVPRELLLELRDSANEAGNLSFRQHHIDHHKRLARRADSLLGGEA